MYLIAATLAQIPTDPATLKQFADEVSQKDFRWWFAIIFAILIASGTAVFKWLIANLREQRQANTEITTSFINNMKDDRLKMMVLLERVTIVLEKLEEDKRLEIYKHGILPPSVTDNTLLQQHGKSPNMGGISG